MNVALSSTAKIGKLKLQPASSFSTNLATASGFSGGHSVFFAKVPASQVLSSYITGFGCTGEHEVVVLAHPDMTAVHVQHNLVAGKNTHSAAMAIEKSLKPATSAPSSPAPFTKSKSQEHWGENLQDYANFVLGVENKTPSTVPQEVKKEAYGALFDLDEGKLNNLLNNLPGDNWDAIEFT
jgi:hypothetical protein